ncbi:MAG: hypothetical protein Q4A49_00180 [Neisseria sp.]|nr:hypothetical protein [Neisseria sp.]
MNKTAWIMLAALVSASAAADVVMPGAAKQEAVKEVYFGTVEMENGRPVLNGKNEFSRLKGPDFCWVVNNLNAGQNYLVASTFVSPAPAEFAIGERVFAKSEDGLKHTGGANLQADSKGQISQCWKFGPSDPVGAYTLTLQIGQEVFEPFQFKVVR